MEHDSKDLDAILRGDDSDDFESYLNRKVAECSRDIPASQLRETLPIAQTAASDAVGNSNVEKLTRMAETVESVISSSASNVAGLDRADLAKRDRALETAKVKAALEAAEKRRLALEAVPESERSALMARLIEEESARIKAEESAVAKTAIEQVPTLEQKTHEVVGTYIQEASEPLSWDEEMMKIFFSVYSTVYDDNLSYEQVKTNVQLIIQRTHELTRGIILAKVQIAGMATANFKLLQKLSVNDRELMLQLDAAERAKNSKRKKKAEGVAGAEKSAKAAKPKVASKGKAQTTAKTFFGLGMPLEAVLSKLRTLSLLTPEVEEYARNLYK